MSAAHKNRALFLDRDGVINEEVGYLVHAKDVRFVQGLFSLCRTAQTLGYKLVVVTNQAGIAGSRLEIYEGAPHALFVTEPDRFNPRSSRR